jgi:hypothetical protein
MADISHLFKHEQDGSVRFVGKELIAYVPKRYSNLGKFTIGDKVSTLGIFTMKVDDILCGLQIPAMITMDPSEISEGTVDSIPYQILTFHENDIFMTTNQVVQDESTGYVIWKEFMGLGNLPSYVTYENIPTFFDDLAEITGAGINVNHAILEMAYAHMFRDPDDRTKLYRLSDTRKEPSIIAIHDVAYGASSTQSRISGSYANQGLNAALLNQSKENAELDDVFRQ